MDPQIWGWGGGGCRDQVSLINQIPTLTFLLKQALLFSHKKKSVASGMGKLYITTLGRTGPDHEHLLPSLWEDRPGRLDA